MLPRQGEEKLEESTEVIAWGASLPMWHAKRVQECSLKEDHWFDVLCWAKLQDPSATGARESRILYSLLAKQIYTGACWWAVG